MMTFRKMHGLGNDFVVFDGRYRGLALDEDAARAIADRRIGIGCDQVIVIGKSATGADAAMRIFNADGDEVEACGNAARCVARLLLEETDQPAVTIETLGGRLTCSEAGSNAVTVDMGAPRLGWKDIPLEREVDTNDIPLEIDRGAFRAAAVSIGNPHCILLIDNAEAAAVEDLGPKIEHHPLFPARTNVEFASVISRRRLRMRVWERGVGVTRACGTGACAVTVAAYRRGIADRKVEIVLDGGLLEIEWRESDSHVLMTGSAALTFTGEVDLAALERRQ